MPRSPVSHRAKRSFFRMKNTSGSSFVSELNTTTVRESITNSTPTHPRSTSAMLNSSASECHHAPLDATRCHSSPHPSPQISFLMSDAVPDTLDPLAIASVVGPKLLQAGRDDSQDRSCPKPLRFPASDDSRPERQDRPKRGLNKFYSSRAASPLYTR